MSGDRAGERRPAATHGASSRRGLDEIHSFVLRVHLYSPPDGQRVRMRFLLEEVGAGQSWRLNDFKTTVERLQERVSAIEATALG